MEKCTFCVQRIRRTSREADRDGREIEDGARELSPACVNSCPTSALVWGDFNNKNSKVSNLSEKEMSHNDSHHGRGYKMMENLGTSPNVIYLKKIDKHAKETVAHE